MEVVVSYKKKIGFNGKFIIAQPTRTHQTLDLYSLLTNSKTASHVNPPGKSTKRGLFSLLLADSLIEVPKHFLTS